MTTDLKCKYVTIIRLKQKIAMTQRKIEKLQELQKVYEKQYDALSCTLEARGIKC